MNLISQDKVNLVIGEVISSASLAIADLAQNAKVPMISASATNLDVTKGKDFVFRTTFTDPFQGIATAKYAKEKGLSIWCYTGFLYEQLLNNPIQKEFLKYIDVLVDGKFIM